MSSSSLMGVAYPSRAAVHPARWPLASELWEALLATDEQRQRVAVLLEPPLDVVDGPAIWSKPFVVEVVPGDRYRYGRALCGPSAVGRDERLVDRVLGVVEPNQTTSAVHFPFPTDEFWEGGTDCP